MKRLNLFLLLILLATSFCSAQKLGFSTGMCFARGKFRATDGIHSGGANNGYTLGFKVVTRGNTYYSSEFALSYSHFEMSDNAIKDRWFPQDVPYSDNYYYNYHGYDFFFASFSPLLFIGGRHLHIFTPISLALQRFGSIETLEDGLYTWPTNWFVNVFFGFGVGWAHKVTTDVTLDIKCKWHYNVTRWTHLTLISKEGENSWYSNNNHLVLEFSFLFDLE